MHGAAASHAQEPGDPETGREILAGIRASVRHIEMLAAADPGNRLLAAAALRATEAAVAAENLTPRQVIAEDIHADAYARGRADMAAAVAGRKHLRAV